MANNIDILDATGTTTTVKTTDNAGTHTPHRNIDNIVAVDATGQGDVPITLGGEAVVLGAGTAAFGKLAANSGVDIGDVDITSIAAGETHIGEVGASSKVVEVTFTLDTSAYADGDVLAATQVITEAMRVNGGTGVLQSIIVLDKDDQGQAMDIVILRTNVGIGTENSAVSVTDTNADEILGIVSVATSNYVDLVGSQLATKTNLGIVVDADGAADDLYFAAISRGTGTYTASGVTAKFGFLQD